MGITPGTTVTNYATSPGPATVTLSQSTSAGVTNANPLTFLTTHITLVSTSEVVVGQFVEGDGVPVGATVSAITGNTITISALTTKAITNGAIAFQRFHHTGTAARHAYTIALDATTHVAVGQHVSGYGIQADAVITNLAGSTVTLDKYVTETLVPGSSLLFQASSGVLTFEKSDACSACTGQPNCATDAATCLGATSELACSVASAGHYVVPKGWSGFVQAGTTPFSTSATASAYSTAVTLTSGANVAVGQDVAGEALPVGTTVSAISGTSLTLSAKTLGVLGRSGKGGTGALATWRGSGRETHSARRSALRRHRPPYPRRRHRRHHRRRHRRLVVVFVVVVVSLPAHSPPNPRNQEPSPTPPPA